MSQVQHADHGRERFVATDEATSVSASWRFGGTTPTGRSSDEAKSCTDPAPPRSEKQMDLAQAAVSSPFMLMIAGATGKLTGDPIADLGFAYRENIEQMLLEIDLEEQSDVFGALVECDPVGAFRLSLGLPRRMPERSMSSGNVGLHHRCPAYMAAVTDAMERVGVGIRI